MRRTLLTWTIFSAALVLVLSVMVYFTVRILQFEQSTQAAETRAEVEENIRLALWRMDSAAGNLLAPAKVQRAQQGNLRNFNPQLNSASNQPAQRLDVQYQNQLSQEEFQHRETINKVVIEPPDWSKIEPKLLEQVGDRLPGARLELIKDSGAKEAGSADDTRRLASISARLVVPPSVFVPPSLPWNTPLRVSLMVAWTCALVASAAVAVLLRGALVLSERRGAFVSAVTHELRTPLTTFKMYSEMLAGGMVADPAARQEYLDTLVTESDRLGYLIENVLAYARLERQLSPRQAQTITLGELLDRAVPSLQRRAERAKLPLQVQIARDVALHTCATDTVAVQQILLNLIDNACKYGQTGLELAVTVSGQQMQFRVSDRGPGVEPAALARLFQAFSKSRSDTAPGIGLGLYLSRRLARDLGGDLRHEPAGQGATFVLTLPL